ncbi:MAG TPA: hypothetical protein VM537_05070 [Anaerolineae bacterium]|nr:hypothetical protein [Anaerolineae bacterium]
MAVVKYQAHTKAEETRPWDGEAARRRLAEWAGGPDKENIDWGKYRKGFAWFDSEKKETFEAYKLPHHDVADGSIVTVWNGVKAAMSALLGARGGTDIPEGDRRGVYDHLAKHYRQFDKEVPEFRAEAQREVMGGQARMLLGGHVALSRDDRTEVSVTPGGGDRAANGPSAANAEKALALINEKFAKVALAPEQVYLLPPAELSNDQVDSYFTRMAQSSLKNYRSDGRAGIPLMNSHRTHPFFNAELPLGRSYWGDLEADEEIQRLVVQFYMLRGLTLNLERTDDIIAAIQGGIQKSLSIGFTGGWYRCSICDREMMDLFWMMLMGIEVDEDEICQHVPGVEYDGELCTAWIEDARAREGSLVYQGGTPDAVIRKARLAAERGWLPAGEAHVLEDRWGVRIWQPENSRHAAGTYGTVRVTELREEVSDDVEDEVVVINREAILAVVGERTPKLLELVQDAEEPLAELIAQWAQSQIRAAAAEEKVQELQALEPLADEGRAYRKSLIERAVEARVRVQGATFDAEAYAKVLEGQPLDYIQAEIRTWDESAEKVFEPGRPVGNVLDKDGDGRKGDDESQEPNADDAAYKA